MATDINMLLDFTKTCRLCLNQTTELCPLYTDHGPADSSVNSLPSKIMACVSIEVIPEHNMPKHICFKCVQQLESWVKFKELCDNANAILNQCLVNIQTTDDTERENIQGQDNFSDMDVSIFERDSLFAAFESQGEWQMSEDLNMSIPDSILNQKIASVVSRPLRGFCSSTPIRDDKSNEDGKLDDGGDIRKTPQEPSVEDSAEKEKRQAQFREKYTRFYQKNYDCGICDKTFTKFMHLVKHDREKHSDKLDFRCTVCGLMFVSQSRINIHSFKHRERTVECDVCHAKFLTRKSLLSHMRKHVNIYTCNVCSAAKSSKHELNDHMRTHTKEKPFSCSLCGKCFSTEHGKNNHQARHLNQKLYTCECGKSFTVVGNYINHIQSHKTTKDLVCDTCGKSFKTDVTFLKHVKSHTTVKDLNKCVMCPLAFPSKYLLERHKATHLDLRPFVCPHEGCKKAFKRKDQVSQHVRCHTRESQGKIVCSGCNISVSNQFSLRRHQRKCKKLLGGNLTDRSTNNASESSITPT